MWQKIHVNKNILSTTAVVDSYLAADLAEFIRQSLLESGTSFTYETVLSHPGKIGFLREAMLKGYKVYLYFIATENPEINVGRVNLRVAKSGHFVPPEVVRSRYFKSLGNLKEAIKNTNRAFIFDNSQRQALFIAEILEGKDVYLNDIYPMPNWVVKYLVDDPT